MRQDTTTIRLLIRTAAGLVLFATAASAQGADGFLRGAGRVDGVWSYGRDSYDHSWVGEDRVTDPGAGRVTRESYSFHVACGLGEDLDLVFDGAHVTASSDGTAGFPDEGDPQDASLGVKWRFWNGIRRDRGFALLFAPSVKFPMSDYEDDSVTAIGDGQVDLRARFVLHAQSANGLYAALESGYDVREGAPHDEVPLNLTLGGTVGTLTLTAFLSRVYSGGGPDIGPGVPLPAVQEEYTRAGAGAYLRLGERYGLNALWRTTLDGLNTGDVESLALGLVFRF